MSNAIKDNVEVYNLDGTDVQLQGNVNIKFGKKVELLLHKYKSSISKRVEPQEKFILPGTIKIALCRNKSKNITLLDGIRISGSGAKYRIDSIYSFRVAFIGEEFYHEEDIKFKEVKVSYSSLANWIGTERVKKCTPEHNIEVELYKNDNFTISVSVVCLPGAGITLTGMNAVRKYISQVVIRSNKKSMSYNEYMQIISNIAFFLYLAEGKTAYPLNIEGTILSDKNVKTYYEIPNYPTHFKTITISKVVFTFDDIMNNVSTILKNLFAFLGKDNKLLSDIVSKVFYDFDRNSIEPFVLLTLLVEVFEGYYNDKASKYNDKTSKSEKNHDGKENSEKLKEKQKHDSKEKGLKGLSYKIYEIFREYETITHSKLDLSDIEKDLKELSNINKLCKFVAQLRDLLVHRAESKRKQSAEDTEISLIVQDVYNNDKVRVVDKINNKLLHVIRVLVLNDIGMPPTVIKKEIDKYKEFVKNTRYLFEELEFKNSKEAMHK